MSARLVLFAILFVLAFFIGAVIYYFSRKWIWAVLVPMGLFIANAITDESNRQGLLFTLSFGIVIVFFSGLLGAYIVQMRSYNEQDDDDRVDEKIADSEKPKD